MGEEHRFVDAPPDPAPLSHDPASRAKHLPLGLVPPALVPARMVNEVLYCERLAYLEWVQGEFADNHFTLDGRLLAHRRVDAKAQPMPEPASTKNASEEEPPPAERSWKARSVWLSSEQLGMTAKVDIVESAADGKVQPVEYKRGRRPSLPEGAWLPERAQLAAQVLLLREHGYACDEAWIWYAEGREKVAIVIDEALEETARDAAARMRGLAASGKLPPPLVNDPKCRGCSLAGICLPDELDALSRNGGTGPAALKPPRRLQPATDHRAPLYVQEPGATVGVRKQLLSVKLRNGSKIEARLPNTSQVCLFGNVPLTTQAIRALLRDRIPVAFFTTGGWFLGRTLAHDSNNVELRLAQYGVHADEASRLRLSRSLIANKIANQRTLVRRNHPEPSPTTLFELKQLARKAREVSSRPALLGIEGTAARTYFGTFTGMLKGASSVGGFDLDGRNRRPPKDPINALLSLAYALLTKDWSLQLKLAGLDPLLGFLHEPRFGRPALALDLMEPFRPIVADSVVLSVINNGEVTPRDFIRAPTGCALTTWGRKRFIAAYERRMAQLITHPVFGYKISYRRILEVQARLLGRHLLGEIEHYPEFRTR